MESPELFERDEPLAQLTARVDALCEGRGGACALVSGEAGIGKTSLLRALQRAAGDRAQWLWGACEPLLAPPPLAPLIDMVDRLPAGVAAAVRGAAQVPTVLPAMYEWMASSTEPLAIVVDDVHWADGATFDLLRYLSRRIEATRALLVLSFRDDALSPGLQQVMAGMPARSTLRVALQPLSRAAVEHLARRAGQDPQAVYGASSGNPFFVSELLAAGAGPVPASVRDAVLARAALLPPAARTALDLLCVMPSPPAPARLEAIEPGARHALQPCIDGGLVVADGEVLAFRHDITRQALESALTPERARALHRRVFEHLERGDSVSAAHRVHHAERAGLADEVLRLAPAAAREAAEASAHHQAAELYGLALSHAAVLPAARRAELHETHADECMLVNRIDAAIGARRAAHELRRQLGDALGQGINLRMLARLEWMRRGPDHAVDLARAALPLLERAGDARELALGYATLAQLQLLGPSSRPALEWGRRALQIAEGIGDVEALAFALNTVACAELRSGDEPASWERIHRSLALSLEHGLEDHAARAYFNLPSLALVQRRLPEALRWCDEGIAYCEARDIDMYASRLRIRRAYAWLELGLWDRAEADLAPLLARAIPTELEREQLLHLRMLIALRRGRAQLELDGGHLADVQAYWRAMCAGERRLSVDPWYSPQALARAEACWLAGDRELLVAIAQASMPAALEAEEPWRIGQLACWLARAGAALPELTMPLAEPCAAELAGDLRAAADAWAQRGCRYEQALSLLGGDAAQVREAIGVLDDLSAEPAARIARARLRAMGVRTGSRGPYRGARGDPLGLTPRERQVLELLSQGLSNRAIAQRLVRSERTIEAHVSALLGKLGVSTREEAVARAASGEI